MLDIATLIYLIFSIISGILSFPDSFIRNPTPLSSNYSEVQIVESNQSLIVTEFKTNFPFLIDDSDNLTATIKFVTFLEGNYTGEIKKSITDKLHLSKNETNGTQMNRGNEPVLESSSMHPIRHGWGKMSWANGTLYGSNWQFIYGEGDNYIGQWYNNEQYGM